MDETIRTTESRLTVMEKAFKTFMSKFEDVPITLALIQKDISLNAELAGIVKENSENIAALKSWRTGLTMAGVLAMFFFGYAVSLIQTNLGLSMEKTAREVVIQELEKYEE